MDSSINDLKLAKADSVRISVEPNLILGRLEKNAQALRFLVNANVERKLTSTDSMAKIRKLLESGLSIHRSDYFVKISKLAREVQ